MTAEIRQPAVYVSAVRHASDVIYCQRKTARARRLRERAVSLDLVQVRGSAADYITLHFDQVAW